MILRRTAMPWRLAASLAAVPFSPATATCAAPHGVCEVRPDDADRIPQTGLTLVGTEPFWSLKIHATSMELEVSGAPKQVFERQGVAHSGFRMLSYNLPALKVIVVAAEECNDGMNDQTYPFEAIVIYDGGALYGCGYSDSHPPVSTLDDSE